MGQKIFISHASEDAAAVNRIVSYLEAHGAPCWISSRDIPPKSIYAEAIAQAMRDAQSCVVVISAASNQSAAVKRELELASRYNKPFIPIRVDATEPGPGLDYYLNNTQWVDYGGGGERALDGIVNAYAARTNAPTPLPAPPRRTLAPLVIAAAIAAVAAGGWLAWTQLNKPPQPQTTAQQTEAGQTEAGQAETEQAERTEPAQTGATRTETAGAAVPGSFLIGAYNWQGLACGEGPTVTQEANGDLVFAMPGTPTYRHDVLGARRNAGDYAVIIRTRVLEPADHAGEAYTFRARTRAGPVEVISGGQTDIWDRCEG